MQGSIHSRRQLANTIVIAAFLVLLVFGGNVQPVEAKAELSLYPDTEDPRQGGHTVDTGVFTLVIENSGSGGQDDNTAYDVFVVFAVNDPALFAGASLLVGSTSSALHASMLQTGTPSMPCSGRNAPPHSVYPAAFTTIGIGDIGEGESVSIDVTVEGDDGLVAHFDAIGIGYKTNRNDVKCYDVINPSGHDVDVVLGDGTSGDCAQLEINKEAGSTAVVLGDELEYVITASNNGTCDLTDVDVVDEIPVVTTEDGDVAAFSVVAAGPPATSQSSLELIWNYAALTPGETVSITVTVVFDEPAADGQHVTNLACVNAAELEHRTCARSRILVGDAVHGIGGPGFWCNQIRFSLEGWSNAQFTLDQLETWLITIEEVSAVFPELVETSELDQARETLCSPNLARDAATRLFRHLLALHFNIASGRIGLEVTLEELCPGSVDRPNDFDSALTIGDIVTGAELALVDGTAGLETWGEVVDFINNATLADDDGCGSSRRVHRRH